MLDVKCNALTGPIPDDFLSGISDEARLDTLMVIE